MNIALWIAQAILALLFVAGGATKAFKFDELAKAPAMRALSRGAWRVLGLGEILGAVLLIVPVAADWSPSLTPLAAGVLALESLGLAAVYGRHSVTLNASNPLIWSLVTALLSAFVAYGRYS